jgi:hypothetical protein
MQPLVELLQRTAIGCKQQQQQNSQQHTAEISCSAGRGSCLPSVRVHWCMHNSTSAASHVSSD